MVSTRRDLLPGGIRVTNLIQVLVAESACEISAWMAAGVSPGIILAQLLVAALRRWRQS